MSGEGGDSSGFGGGDNGGGGKGGGGATGGGDFNSAPVDNNEWYSTPPANSGGALEYTSPGEQAGFQGAGLPDEITTGGSSGSGGFDLGQWSTPGINDYLPGGTDGFNLAGSGPVGGTSPAIGSDVFSSSSSSAPLGQDTNALGTTAPAGGGGIGATAFAAPEGVSGSTDLSSLVSDPTKAAGAGGALPDSSVLDSLGGAQNSVVSEYADAHAGDVRDPTLPATTSGSGGTSKSGDGGGAGSGISIPGLNSSNALGVGAAGVGLLNNLINGKSSTPSMNALTGQANTANANAAELLARGKTQGDTFGTPALQSGQDQTARGAALQQFVATGTLPQGYEDQVQQAAQSAKQTIISNYANRGLPTDPTRNSSLAQELAQVDARLPAAREQLAAQLASTGNSIVASGNATSQTGNALTSNQLITDGLQSSGISSQIYQTLANLENDQNKQRGTAIANFAAALNGGNKGVNINLGGTKAA